MAVLVAVPGFLRFRVGFHVHRYSIAYTSTTTFSSVARTQRLSPIAHGHLSPTIFDSSSPPIFSNAPFSNIPSHGIRKADVMEPSNSESDCSGCSDCESDSDTYAYNSDAPLHVTAAHIRGGAERRLKRSRRLAGGEEKEEEM